MSKTYPDYVRCVNACDNRGLTAGRIYPVHAHAAGTDDFYTITNDDGELQGNYGYRFEPATEGAWVEQNIAKLLEDWTVVADPEPDIYEAADIEAEKARMSPEALDGPFVDHLQELADLDADWIEKPDHYARWSIEPITFIMRNGFEFWRGNIVKYASRAGFKTYDGMDQVQSEITDLQKVIRYAEMRINQLNGEYDL